MAIIGPSRPSRLCHACGTTIDAEAEICPYCGVRQGGLALNARTANTALEGPSHRKVTPATLMALLGFVGFAGMHRFYAGKKGTGLLMLLTVGGLGVWTIVDLLMLLFGSFRDKEGRPLTEW